VNVKDMAARMSLADLSIGAAGGTSWERCCLGLPTLLVILAENQAAGAKALEASGAARTVSGAECLKKTLPSELAGFATISRLKQMSEAAAEITDGNGAFRVVQAMSSAVGRA
jgi:spore coat polysaccharide biosynthesis predicted glycosyltransferase SpsG